MSLEGVYDPMVRAYFAGQCANSGGGVTNGFYYDKTKTYETAFLGGVTEFTKLSDATKVPDSGWGVVMVASFGGDAEGIAIRNFIVQYDAIPGIDGLIDDNETQFGMIVSQAAIDSEDEEIAAIFAGFTPGLWAATQGGSENFAIIFTP